MRIVARVLYLLDVGHRSGLLIPDEDGVPSFLEEQPFTTRAAYLDADRVEGNDFQTAQIGVRPTNWRVSLTI